MDNALKVIQNVEDITNLINELPNKLDADDKELVKDIDDWKEKEIFNVKRVS